MNDQEFQAAIQQARQAYREDAGSQFVQLKQTVQTTVLEAARKGKSSVYVSCKGAEHKVIQDVLAWCKAVGMQAKYVSGDQRDPMNDIHIEGI